MNKTNEIKIKSTDIRNIAIIVVIFTAAVWIFTLMQPITTTEGVVDKFGRDGPVLIEVYANWCKYCPSMKPIIEGLQSEHPEINVKLINADENNIKMSLPRLIIVRTDGTYTDNEGAMPEEGFKLWVLSNYK